MTDHPTTEGRSSPADALARLMWAANRVQPFPDDAGDLQGWVRVHRLRLRDLYDATLAARAALPAQEPLDVERPTDAEVTAELHRVLCMNAKHRSRFTGQCSAGPNIARGLRARLREER